MFTFRLSFSFGELREAFCNGERRKLAALDIEKLLDTVAWLLEEDEVALFAELKSLP